jgi:hypothetical protein
VHVLFAVRARHQVDVVVAQVAEEEVLCRRETLAQTRVDTIHEAGDVPQWQPAVEVDCGLQVREQFRNALAQAPEGFDIRQAACDGAIADQPVFERKRKRRLQGLFDGLALHAARLDQHRPGR